MTAAVLTDGVARPRLTRTRVVALHTIYGLLALWALVMSAGVVELAVGALPAGPWRFAAGATTPWKVLSEALPLVLIAISAGRNVVAVQAFALGELVWILTQLIAPQHDSSVATMVLNAGIWLAPWFLLTQDRRAFFRLQPRPDLPLLGAAAVSVGPLALWAHATATTSLPHTPHDIDATELRFDLTGLAVMLAAALLFGALRPVGRRWPALAAGASAAWVGVLAVVWPGDYASPGRAWGLALVALGAAVTARQRQL